MLPSGADIDTWISLGREWRGQVLGQPPLDFAGARKRFRAGARFTLHEVTEADVAAIKDPTADVARTPEVGVALMVLRRNGELVFASSEAPDTATVPGDKVLLLAEPEGVARAGAEAAVLG